MARVEADPGLRLLEDLGERSVTAPDLADLVAALDGDVSTLFSATSETSFPGRS